MKHEERQSAIQLVADLDALGVRYHDHVLNAPPHSSSLQIAFPHGKETQVRQKFADFFGKLGHKVHPDIYHPGEKEMTGLIYHPHSSLNEHIRILATHLQRLR